MSYCRVCGSWDDVEYRPSKRQSLCDACNAETPRKVSREAFDKAYWGTGKNADEVPEGVKREFYSDYLTSGDTVQKYIESTTTKLD